MLKKLTMASTKCRTVTILLHTYIHVHVDPTILPTRGPASKYVITDPNGQTVKASIDFEFLGEPMRVMQWQLKAVITSILGYCL